MLVGVVELLAEEFAVGGTDRMERQHRPQGEEGIADPAATIARSAVLRLVERLARIGPLGQDEPGLADEPLVGLACRSTSSASDFARRSPNAGLDRLAVGDLEDAAAGAVDAGALVALAGVAPVEHEDAAVGAVAEVDPAEEGVRAEEEVLAVMADVAAARTAPGSPGWRVGRGSSA